jgi:hypothetical protein
MKKRMLIKREKGRELSNTQHKRIGIKRQRQRLSERGRSTVSHLVGSSFWKQETKTRPATQRTRPSERR